ncbi:hypothetical protein DENSPDRAFT_780589 [Dentipellis sp. KUC8613]|nr:hypothetical protein DENSPDRAFT_780589 [Dentipellis sp. KUC8613]
MTSSRASGTVTAADFDDYNTRLQAAALTATRNSAGLPSDLGFHRSVDRDLAKGLDTCSDRILNITNKLLGLTATAGTSKGKGKGKLEDQDDFMDRFESLIVESMDQLLERADICLDQYSGRTKAPAIAINPTQPAAQKTSRPKGRLEPVIQHAPQLAKPQLKFKRKVDNTNGVVWYPSLRHKYNAQVPLGFNFHPNDEDPSVSLAPHPYRHEITNIAYPPQMFKSQAPISPKSFEDTPFTWVSTPEAFAAMLAKLKTSSEIAIDLEYHSYRTFGGFVCLMQVSNRDEDWIVDTLELRDELEDLNEVTTNPNIVKVFHGAESDIVWLQQDFNIYIVNLFDTFHASKVLEFPKHGLGTLLEMYCDFTADKRYQLADWRIRPLTDDMLKYARSDTHFLLYIYDNLRNALLDRSLSRAQSPSTSAPTSAPSSRPPTPTPTPESCLRDVLARSADTSLRVYEREYYDAAGGTGPSGWDTMARKWNKAALMADAPAGLNREVYKAVHGWRDRVAREEDESVRYVLPNHLVFRLAEQPPADMPALLAAFQSVPPVIRRRAKDLLDAIRAAIKRAFKEATGAASTSAVPEQHEGMDVDAPAQTTAPTVEAPVPAPASDLWARKPVLPSSSTSALFGSSSTQSQTSAAPSVSSYSAAQSQLFVALKKPPAGKPNATSAFEDVVKQIHSALAIAPTLPQVPSANAVKTEPTASASTSTDPTPAAQDEIPFVPAAQRQAKPKAESDEIVVVGQRQKKRKRTKKTDADGELEDASASSTPAPASAASGKKAGKKKAGEEVKAEEDVVPFDYASAPNILDDVPVVEEKRQKKRQKKNRSGGAVEYGNFPAPPRDRTQVRSGNQSHTFK